MRGGNSQLTVLYAGLSEGLDVLVHAQDDDDNTFMFRPSDGAVAYELELTAAGTTKTVIYAEVRQLPHCGITNRNGQDDQDGFLRWWLSSAGLSDADCENLEMLNEPRLRELVRSGDLSWRVYAIGADGGRREAWHIEEPPGCPSPPAKPQLDPYFAFDPDVLDDPNNLI